MIKKDNKFNGSTFEYSFGKLILLMNPKLFTNDEYLTFNCNIDKFKEILKDFDLVYDNKEYKKALDEMNEVFRKSLPFFEEAHKMDPQDRNYMQILKGLYYRFHMDDKYNAISEELNNL